MVAYMKDQVELFCSHPGGLDAVTRFAVFVDVVSVLAASHLGHASEIKYPGCGSGRVILH